MKIIKLKTNELEFLKKECDSLILKKYISEGHTDEKSSSLILILSKNDLEVICDELSDFLMDRGIGEDGEINKLGKQIDDLIDKFNHYV
jgi:hypothetical protein